MYNSSFFAFSLLSIFAGINVEGVSIGRTSGQLESVDAQVPGLGTYRGVHITDNIRTSVLGSLRISNVKQPIGDNLTAPVLAWLGIDYVKQPTGDLRFRPPQKLDVYNRNLEDRVINATQYGVICPQAGLGAFWPMGEGCLSLNIYRPAGITLEKKLPVAFYIHGGTFNLGAGRMFNGASFVASAQTPIMMVTINYRIGALGFLPSNDTAAAGLLSLGLRDQVAAMEWVNEYIGYFGGDKDKVTLIGLSAGARSVGWHMLDYKPGVDPLFHRVIMSSGSPTSRGYNAANWPLYERQYREFLDKVGCLPGSGVWKCLREADIQTISQAQNDLYNSPYYTWHVSSPFQPALGGPLLPVVPTVAWETGNFYKVPVIVGSVQDEGSIFVPQNLSTNAEYRDFFKGFAPLLTEASIDKIDDLYPDPVTHPDSPYSSHFFAAQFERLQSAYGDCIFSCQAEETAVRASRYESFGSPVWRYYFAQNNTLPPWQGIPHGADMTFQANEEGTKSPRVASIYNSWLTSFVATGDPNTFALKEFQGAKTPYWERYHEEKDVQIRMGPDGDLSLEPNGHRKRECAFWRSIPSQLGH